MKYKITDIKNFIEATTCRTISQAAQKLEISQPALSESIKNLESDLGCILFYRSRIGIQLTPSGKLFLVKAQNAFSAFEDLDLNSNQEGVFKGRTISIGCHATVASYFIPKAFKYLKEKAPDFNISLAHDLSRNIQSEVQKGNVDIGIVINANPVPDLIISKVTEDIVGVWATTPSMKSNTVICNSHLFQTQSILKKWKNKPSKIIHMDNFDLICNLVEEEIGYGIIPAKAVTLYRAKLKNLKSMPSYEDEFSIVYRPEFGKIPAEKLVIDALKNAILT